MRPVHLAFVPAAAHADLAQIVRLHMHIHVAVFFLVSEDFKGKILAD